MDNFLDNINAYYTNRLQQFGATPSGVDWRDEASQLIRFKQLSKLITKNNFSLIDYGCGYGALHSFLKNEQKQFSYLGYDISASMIEAAINNKKDEIDCSFTTDELQLRPSNYVIASGIFNVRLSLSDAEWEKYITDTIGKIDNLSNNGFSFNMLPSYADSALRKDYLYYADINWIKNECKKITKGNVVILKNYNLFEFTILITK